VLPSWSKPVRIAVAPDRVVVYRSASGQPERGIIDCTPGAGAPHWGAAMGALKDALEIAKRRTRVTVILSNRLVRFLLVPWSAELSSDGEWRTWIQHHFQKVFGAEAGRQEFRWQTQGPGQPLVASAVDKALLEALEATIKASGAQLVSVEPYLQLSFNRFRHHFNLSSQWWALLEPKHLTVALLHAGRFISLRTHVAGPDWPERLPVWLEREWAICEHQEASHEVFVCAPETAAGAWPLCNGWNFRRLEGAASAESSGTAFAMVAEEH
jgi:hypothetical protein